MFTLKFFNTNKDLNDPNHIGNFWNVVSAPQYHVSERIEPGGTRQVGALVTVYPTVDSEGGVEYQIGMDERGYDTLFIENEAGKTIDRIGPFNPPAELVSA